MNIKKVDGSFIIEINGLPYHTNSNDRYYNDTLKLYKSNPELFKNEIESDNKIFTYKELRMIEYPSITEQLDMIYHDKINNTNNWINKITEIKNKYPKNKNET